MANMNHYPCLAKLNLYITLLLSMKSTFYSLLICIFFLDQQKLPLEAHGNDISP